MVNQAVQQIWGCAVRRSDIGFTWVLGFTHLAMQLFVIGAVESKRASVTVTLKRGK